MPVIFVNTDNDDDHHKIFIAKGLGAAGPIEKKMQDVVKETIRKAGADFTIDPPDPPKGYSLRLTATGETSGRSVTCSINVEILRYPYKKVKKGTGEEMVPISYKPGHATLEGASAADVLDAIGQLTESIAKAAQSPMRIDMTRR